MAKRSALLRSPLRIALLIPSTFGYARDVLRGIPKAPEGPRDALFFRFPVEMHFLPAVKRWRPHGIIGFLKGGDPLIPHLRALDTPVVNVGNEVPEEPFCRVGVDDAAVGRMAAAYFRYHGYRHLAFVHYPELSFSLARAEAFRAAGEAEGCTCYEFSTKKFWERFQQEFFTTFHRDLRNWLARLPKPLGILAANDALAREVAVVCDRLGMHVPQQAAILGVDNDELECLTAHPPISSIQLPGEAVGEQAYEMLQQLIFGAPCPTSPQLLQPLAVVTRESSDGTAIEDPEVAAALRFIRDNAHRPIGPRDIFELVPVSRRVMEKRFAQVLGRSPLREIQRVRIDMACRHLLDSDIKISDVAARCGFINQANFNRTFRALTGETPAGFRRSGRMKNTRKA